MNASASGSFTILEHPSDIGIEASGGSLETAFVNAAKGLVSLIVEEGDVKELETRSVHLDATDLENLLVKWLSEILYLFDGEKFLPASFTIDELSPHRLDAEISGESFHPERHRAKLDVKAVTYHQLRIKRQKEGYTLRVFVDI